MLKTTAEAAALTGLSAYELRRGYKAGIYPALCIGRPGSRQRLRWNLEKLEAAISDEMEKNRGACTDEKV